MKLLFVLLSALPGLALAALAPPLFAALADVLTWLIVTPAGPIVALLAILSQAQHPVYTPAVVLTPMSDRELLASLLAREVHYGA